ncbi:MAG: 30S ribosomal protein S8 [Candidatus Zambryskibacteria bacterium RIFCSPLOWO2_02_FULL_51_21]|uniref:Small ribosomal subunit protein uS8 n=1 Tax=Candidatus Zambryskibacteria bacterium RIFCSPHIGHO2_02_FULL_43_37 TaxID=1802749 RepID=A0A1G2TGT4_9BACT|nr:MAG: 30S ribosomal protein S8 [Candidatus Zambryskibacteria bacterium RIFCSPHIGHO2_01_FULL_52_18]OHA96423.1 MAG: 30S ribosomal protein S8 [Candidatus Zambryskibacteria bacterium RIFCSPHIGHO2_02_FULL_43_37]OHB07365.1 MAG: 30S ribosomal protein S8 [Candidatus Zambryskibacteria bacterium RIFCSPLOWO2_01_FULL_52_12]OHB11317.1 MAG: 30S ribosomal protein S8 [Candidatus Zambryskibacteria bacterium RIFCSPLOWO2_02_FULL_51_21]
MDQISNFIIQIKNAGLAGHESVAVPYSKLKEAIAQVLKNEKFIKDFEVKTAKGKNVLEVSLLSENRIPKINGVQRISKPSKRIYKKAGEMRPVKNGYGALIVSTSAGVMSGRDAKKQKLGGEALFSIW